jgi:RecA/RadA recombinase
LQYVNLLELKGHSSLSLTQSFNPAQQAAYDSLAHTPEVTFIHGPFGTGKTTLNIAHAVETISNPDAVNKVLYIVESNAAVDDVGLCIRAKADTSGLKHKLILRAHALKDQQQGIIAPEPILRVGGSLLAPMCHNQVQRNLLAMPGRDVRFVRDGIRPDQVATHRPSYINAILIQRAGILIPGGSVRTVAGYAQSIRYSRWVYLAPPERETGSPRGRYRICSKLKRCLDKKDYLIPQNYGNCIDEEYQQQIIEELEADRFEMRIMDSLIASNPEDGVPMAEIYESTARAYFAFIDFSHRVSSTL